MLKKFFLNFLSSFVAVWVALGLFTVTAVIVIVALMAKAGVDSAQVEEVKKHSVLRIDLNGPIEETEKSHEINYMDLLQGNVEKAMTLDVLTQSIREAATNKNIDLLYLHCGALAASPATINALRDELVAFKESGKRIYAYGESYTTGTYYLASLADSVFMDKMGSLDLRGLGGTSLYMKDLFDNLGITFQVVKVGTYKSAVEPYLYNEMSQPARAQLDTLYGNMWRYMLGEIADSRKLKADRIEYMINQEALPLQNAEYTVKSKLADRVVYTRQMEQILADAVNVDVKKLNFVSPSTLVMQTDWMAEIGSKNQLAVLYATGEIAEGVATGINCEALVPEIVRLADDDNIKGMVLRVNSPGGSVFGSAQIGEALDYFKSKGKPLAVSMGDYAASGGYWISCGADRIFADPLTITGSIGIFGLIPNIQGLMQKIGVTPQTVATDPEAAFPSLFYPMTESQHAKMQSYVERGYDQFINRVAKGRKMKPAKVRLIAEGRVWDAMKAKEIGLVDELGQLQDACDWVRGKVEDGDKLDVVAYPNFEPGFMDILMKQANTSVTQLVRENVAKLAPSAPYAEIAFRVVTRKPVQARMPDIQVKP